MNNVRLLDCTLRDGSHLNKGVFGKEVITNIVKMLNESKVDIIELGFLEDQSYDINTTWYKTIEEVKLHIPENLNKNVELSMMTTTADLSDLEPYDGTISYVRFAPKSTRIDETLEMAQKVKDKGYKVYFNAVNCNVYSDAEYIELIEKVNKLDPYGFSIVDTFGTLRKEDLTRIYGIVDHNLNKDTVIGLHLHENLGLASLLAQHFIEINNSQRNITIDASIFGMGRQPGNLCTEQIMDHMNHRYGTTYNIEPIYDAIDDFVAPLKEKLQWGYAVPYALSAKFGLHRTYAEFFMNKNRLRTKDINRLLSLISPEESVFFNEEYAEGLYRKYMSIELDDSADKSALLEELSKYEKILIIAPGPSINDAAEVLQEYAKNPDVCVIAVNFNPDFLEPQYLFFTNNKRIGYANLSDYAGKTIITSNLLEDCPDRDYAFAYNNCVFHEDDFCDDSVMMLLNLLKRMNIYESTVAGFDGFKKSKKNFMAPYMEIQNIHDNSEIVKTLLKNQYDSIILTSLTPSMYFDEPVQEK